MLFVGISKFHYFATNQVANASSDIYESEAISRDPKAWLYSLGIFVNKSESLLKPILHVSLLKQSLRDRLFNRSLVEFKQVESRLER